MVPTRMAPEGLTMVDRARAFEVAFRRGLEDLVLELDHDAWELRDLIAKHGGVGAATRI